MGKTLDCTPTALKFRPSDCYQSGVDVEPQLNTQNHSSPAGFGCRVADTAGHEVGGSAAFGIRTPPLASPLQGLF